jgi:hypothetical protein
VLEELGTLESSTPTRLSGIHQALEISNLFVMVGFHPCFKRLEHLLDGICYEKIAEEVSLSTRYTKDVAARSMKILKQHTNISL